MIRTRIAVIIAFAASLVGCSHASNQGTLPAVGAKGSAATEQVQFKLVISKSPTATGRTPRYVSPATKSLSISINGGLPMGFDLGSAGFPRCTPDCLFTVDAPIGNDTFTVSTFDQPLTSAGATTGNLLSTGTVAYTVLAGNFNQVPLTLNGVVASFSVSVPNSALAAGVAGSTAVWVTAFDADGNYIVGPGSYIDAQGHPVAITLSSDNACSCTTLSNTTITTPNQTGLLSYNGTPPLGIYPTITASWGAVHSSALGIINAYMTQYVTQGLVDDLAFAPDGTLWFPERQAPQGTFAGFGHLNISTGALTEIPNADYNLSNIAAGPDGTMWFFGEQIQSPSTAGIVKIPPGGGPIAFLPLPYTDQYNRYLANGNASALAQGPNNRVQILNTIQISGNATGTSSDVTMLTLSASGPFAAYRYPDPPGAPSGIEWGAIPSYAATTPDQILHIVQRHAAVGSQSYNSGIWKFDSGLGLYGFIELPAPDSGFVSEANGVTVGHDGDLWVTAGEISAPGSTGTDKTTMVYRVTTSGNVTRFNLPASDGSTVRADGIAAPPGEFQWAYVNPAGGGSGAPTELARIDSSGAVTYVNLRGSFGQCTAYCGGGYQRPMLVGPDGLLYTPNNFGIAKIQY